MAGDRSERGPADSRRLQKPWAGKIEEYCIITVLGSNLAGPIMGDFFYSHRSIHESPEPSGTAALIRVARHLKEKTIPEMKHINQAARS